MADPNIPPSTSGLDIAAFITAFFAPVIGLVLGIVAVVQERRRPRGPSGLAIAAVAISSASILLLVVTVVVFLSGGPLLLSTFDPAPTAAPTSAAPSFAPVDERDCEPSDVEVTAIADTFTAGESPLISMTITNVSATACTADVGTAAQQYAIYDGDNLVALGRLPYRRDLHPDDAFARCRGLDDPVRLGSHILVYLDLQRRAAGGAAGCVHTAGGAAALGGRAGRVPAGLDD